MSDSLRLREPYLLAGCCTPCEGDAIVGYHSHDPGIKVHRADCVNLERTETERLVPLEWAEIIAPAGFTPEGDYDQLDVTDFQILQHHAEYGLDYSLVVARAVGITRAEAFKHHRKLRRLGLIERIDKLMIQYRKGVVDNKWIKHRNHTYYDLTEKGRAYLDYFNSHGLPGASDEDLRQP